MGRTRHSIPNCPLSTPCRGTRLQLLSIFCRKQRGRIFYFLLLAGSRWVEVSVQIFVESRIKAPFFLLCTSLSWDAEGMGFLLSTLCRKYTIVLARYWRGELSTHLSVWMTMGESLFSNYLQEVESCNFCGKLSTPDFCRKQKVLEYKRIRIAF